MKLILAEPFKTLWAGRDAFAEVEKLQGARYFASWRPVALRTEVDGRPYFVKIHRGIGWGDLQEPDHRQVAGTGADPEWAAIHLQALGVPTMTGVAFGEKGSNPADQHSFIITEELAPTLSLEDLTVNWVAEPRHLHCVMPSTAELARMVGDMHRGGGRTTASATATSAISCWTPRSRLTRTTSSFPSSTCTVPNCVPSADALARRDCRRCITRRWRLA